MCQELADLVEADLAKAGAVTKASSAELESLYQSMGIVSIGKLFNDDGGNFAGRHRKAGLNRWYEITYDPSVPLTKASGDLSSVPGIDIVEPVRNIRLTGRFNDPGFPNQWHYYNDGKLGSKHKSGADINVEPVWENYTVGSDKVIVSVVDGGIDLQHEDLAGNCVSGNRQHFNFVDNSYQIVAHDHGTHVAGTVAAVNNNGIGVSGVAGGDHAKGISGVKLLSCQIFKTDPDDPSKDLGGSGAAAIVWGADHGAVISQNSWGYSYETQEDASKGKISFSIIDSEEPALWTTNKAMKKQIAEALETWEEDIIASLPNEYTEEELERLIEEAKEEQEAPEGVEEPEDNRKKASKSDIPKKKSKAKVEKDLDDDLDDTDEDEKYETPKKKKKSVKEQIEETDYDSSEDSDEDLLDEEDLDEDSSLDDTEDLEEDETPRKKKKRVISDEDDED